MRGLGLGLCLIVHLIRSVSKPVSLAVSCLCVVSSPVKLVSEPSCKACSDVHDQVYLSLGLSASVSSVSSKIVSVSHYLLLLLYFLDLFLFLVCSMGFMARVSWCGLIMKASPKVSSPDVRYPISKVGIVPMVEVKTLVCPYMLTVRFAGVLWFSFMIRSCV